MNTIGIENITGISQNLSQPSYRCAIAAEDYADFAATQTSYVYLVLYPVILAVCAISSTAVITFQVRSKIRGSKDLYIAVKAVSDLLALSMELPYYVSTVSPPAHEHPAMAKVILAADWMEPVCETFSDFVLVLYSSERFYSVWKPMEFRHQRSISQACPVLAFAWVVAAVINLPNLAAIPYTTVHEQPGWLDRWIVVMYISSAAEPFVCIFLMFCLNALVTYRMRQSTESLRKSTNRKSGSADALLFADVVLAILTMLPYAFYQALAIASRRPFCSYSFPLRKTVQPVVYIWSLIDYSGSFYVYLAVSPTYRRRFLNTMGQIKTSITGNVQNVGPRSKTDVQSAGENCSTANTAL